MNYYLIDYENVQNFADLDKLGKNDSLILFFSENANKISLDVVSMVLAREIAFETIKVECNGKGKNALDFQLSSYLGYLISQNKDKNAKFYIISKDNGYSNVVQFWKKREGVQIKLIADLSGQTQEKIAEKSQNDMRESLRKANLGLSEEDIAKAIDIVEQYKTKTAINNNLNKYLKDSDKVGKVLKNLNVYIKDKNK